MDLEKKAIYLSSLILGMAGKKNPEKLAQEILKSGKAYQKFRQIIEAQGGKIKELLPAKFSFTIKAEKSGKVMEIDNKKISKIARVAGCPMDKSSGLFLYVHINDKVSKGDSLLTIYTSSQDELRHAKEFYERLKPIIF
jgi:thymidine phosphorylase